MLWSFIFTVMNHPLVFLKKTTEVGRGGCFAQGFNNGYAS